MTNLKNRFQAAKKRLTDSGWELVLSSMNDGGTNGEYGSLFMKEKMTIWVNIETLPALEMR
jgi:hypothetical protein